MNIPEFFAEKIKRVFGDKGKNWLEELPNIIYSCKKKWKLTELTVVDDLSFNYVCASQSAFYGDVVLKIGVPHPEFYTELNSLSFYKDEFICKSYDSDKQFGAILLERIIPGDNLLSLDKSDKWLEIVADMAYKLPVEIENESLFPNYENWIDKAFNRARRENKVGEKMLCYIEKAENIFNELEQKNYSKVLLHGDLHHWNILYDKYEGWKAIDPKGVIGIPVMESARFLDNQITITESLGDFTALDKMISVFSNKFSESKTTIASNLFILLVLSTCWSYENHSPKNSSLKHRQDKCSFVNKYMEDNLL